MRVNKQSDGMILVELSPSEAIDVRDDIGNSVWSDVTESGDKLHSLLESLTPKRKLALVSYGGVAYDTEVEHVDCNGSGWFFTNATDPGDGTRYLQSMTDGRLLSLAKAIHELGPIVIRDTN